MRIFFFISFCLLFSYKISAQKTNPIDASLTYTSFLKADSILQQALKAHGGLEKIKAIKNISLEFKGMRTMINQSRTVDAPWDKEPSVGKVVVDMEHKQVYSFNSSSYPGIGAFAGVFMVKGNEGFHYEPDKNYMGDEIVKLTGDGLQSPWNYSRRWLPPLLLLQMLENKSNLRFLGTIQRNSEKFYLINFTQPKGNVMSVYFDTRRLLLRGYETIRDDGVYGDVSEEGIFEDYQNFKGIILPQKRIDYFNGQIAREINMTLAIDSPIDSDLFAYPVDYVEAKENTNYQRILKIADGVFIDQDMGGVMFVEFDNFVVVLDCPGNFASSYSTIQEIRKTIPNKAIRYIIPSHTHGDHGGGARAYYFIGAILLTTPAHRDFYQNLALIKQHISQDSLALFPQKPIIEIFSGKKIITDGKQTLELYDAGPNAHSREITFAYLPKQKIIWQVDMFFVPGTGTKINKAMPITQEFAKKLKSLKIDHFDFIIDGHNSRLITKKQFEESLRLGGF